MDNDNWEIPFTDSDRGDIWVAMYSDEETVKEIRRLAATGDLADYEKAKEMNGDFLPWIDPAELEELHNK